MFRAYEPEGDRLVAVKLFRLDLSPERVRELVDEFEWLIHAGLTHAGIAAPLATGITGDAAYLVQEFTAADSLDIVIRDYGPAPPADALRLAVQLAGALDFAAAVNVDHGALHPRDVLISSDDMRMTGLGVGRALEHIGVTLPVRRPYTAPERMSGVPWDRRADVFSLAALLHEMLWGRRVAGTGRQVADGLTEVAGADLAVLGHVFARAMAEDPADRFGTALAFASALENAFGGLHDSTTHRPAADVSAKPRLPLDEPEVIGVAEPEIREPEAARYRDVGSAAEEGAMPLKPPDEQEPAFRAPQAFDGALYPPIPFQPSGLLRSDVGEPIAAIERSQMVMWPAALALIVGIAVGFGAGYGLGSRGRAVTIVTSTPGAASSAPAVPGREFTESAVNEPPKTTPATFPPGDVRMKPDATGELKPDATGAGNPGATGVPVAEVGRLLVRSTPAGARVFVDGRDLGRTPAIIRDLGRGSHRVRLVQEGYATEERRVVITPANPAPAVIVAMTRTRPEAPPARGRSGEPTPRPAGEPFVGSLSVDSRPTGAKVFLDGKLAGATPLMLSQIPAGEHAVRLEHDGYRRWSSSVRIVSGERNRVTASLER